MRVALAQQGGLFARQSWAAVNCDCQREAQGAQCVWHWPSKADCLAYADKTEGKLIGRGAAHAKLGQQ